MPEPTKVRSIRLPESLWQAIDTEATRQRRNVNNLIAVTLEVVFDPDAPDPLWDEIERRLKA